jgi:hypothetical protein
MLFRNCTDLDLHAAADRARVRLVNLRPEGRGFRATLGLLADPDGAPPAPHWQRRSASWRNPRRVNAVCWHGHAVFFLHLFLLEPRTKVRGGRSMEGPTTYDGAADFLWKYDATGDENIGSQMYPVAYRDACGCNGMEEQQIEDLTQALWRQTNPPA